MSPDRPIRWAFIALILACLMPQTAGAQNPAGDSFAAAVLDYRDGNYESARWVFKRLAEDGHSGAETMLGVLYFNGQGVEKDYANASIWFFKAARQGNPNAQLAFGALHIHGRGVQQNLVTAYKWLALAAERGDPRVVAEYNRLISEISDLMTAEERETGQAAARSWQVEVPERR